MIKRPPGPSALSSIHRIFLSPKKRLALFVNLARDYGDISYLRVGAEQVYFLNHPDLIREVLVTQHRSFAKGRGLERTKRFLGEGLLTSEGALHLRQRRMMQPAFHQQRIAAFAETMTAETESLTRRWSDGETLEMTEEMSRLTLAIVSRTLLGTKLDHNVKDIRLALTAMLQSFPLMMLPFPNLLEKLPLPAIRRMKAARAHLDQLIYQFINDRRASGKEENDLLAMLLAAQDEEDPTVGMSDRQVRDEAMTIFLAGHETTANALSWTWYLLARHPEVEAKLHKELDRALQEGMPRLADIPALPYSEKVISESLRLYPPAWMIGRRALQPCQIGGYTIPARAMVLMSQYVMQRDARYFEDPLCFRPERWTTEFKAALPRFAFFPFGGGPRQCLGEGFAWMEAILLLATIARRWELRLLPATQVTPQPLVTLRPRHGLSMRVIRRS